VVLDGPYVYVAAGQTGMDIIDSSPAPRCGWGATAPPDRPRALREFKVALAVKARDLGRGGLARISGGEFQHDTEKQ
jgi:hypothetical protein